MTRAHLPGSYRNGGARIDTELEMNNAVPPDADRRIAPPMRRRHERGLFALGMVAAICLIAVGCAVFVSSWQSCAVCP